MRAQSGLSKSCCLSGRAEKRIGKSDGKDTTLDVLVEKLMTWPEAFRGSDALTAFAACRTPATEESSVSGDLKMLCKRETPAHVGVSFALQSRLSR